MDERRYQVFVSSTYMDLIEHRQTVMKALMQVDAIPAGMELFPALDADAWTLIERVIDQSDYYIVIIGGKYGSVGEDGVSYTEKEYDYAASKGKPIAAFLHAAPDELAVMNSETDVSLRQKLEMFRQKARKRLCKFWRNPDELTIAVLTSYHHLTNANPTEGWMRSGKVKTGADAEVLSQLQQRISQLDAENKKLRDEAVGTAGTAEASLSEVEMPSIARTFKQFLRRLFLEWEAEKDANPRLISKGKEIIDRAREALLEYIVEIDEGKHPSVAFPLQRFISDLTALERKEDSGGRNDFWAEGSTLLYQLRAIEGAVVSERWTE